MYYFILIKIFFRLKVAPHESPPGSPRSSGEEQGETTPEEGAEGHLESASAEAPMTLQDLLG